MKLPAPLVHLLERLSPWLLPIAAIGAMGELVGGGWDINWHIEHIPEVFWTPPHITLYSGATVVLVATAAAFLLRWAPTPRSPSVQFGSMIAFAGAALQLVAGGFDSAWHAAFGADDALSPPHVMLTTAILITAVGVVVALHAWRRTQPSTGLRATVAWVSHAVGVTAVAWAAWGWLFILTFPGFAAGSPLVANFGLRLLTGAAFAALFPLMLIAAVQLVGRWGAATIAALTQYIVSVLIGILMGGAPGAVEILFGLSLFVLPGLVVDVVYRPGRRGSENLALTIGAVLGQWGFVPIGIVGGMTEPFQAPAAFALAFLAGGIAGSGIAIVFGRTASGLEARDRVAASITA